MPALNNVSYAASVMQRTLGWGWEFYDGLVWKSCMDRAVGAPLHRPLRQSTACYHGNGQSSEWELKRVKPLEA